MTVDARVPDEVCGDAGVLAGYFSESQGADERRPVASHDAGHEHSVAVVPGFCNLTRVVFERAPLLARDGLLRVLQRHPVNGCGVQKTPIWLVFLRTEYDVGESGTSRRGGADVESTHQASRFVHRMSVCGRIEQN